MKTKSQIQAKKDELWKRADKQQAKGKKDLEWMSRSAAAILEWVLE